MSEIPATTEVTGEPEITCEGVLEAYRKAKEALGNPEPHVVEVLCDPQLFKLMQGCQDLFVGKGESLALHGVTVKVREYLAPVSYAKIFSDGSMEFVGASGAFYIPAQFFMDLREMPAIIAGTDA